MTPIERRKTLAQKLREPLVGMEWEFETVLCGGPSCGTSGCAMGYASLLWPEEFKLRVAHGDNVNDDYYIIGIDQTAMENLLGMNYLDFDNIFYGRQFNEKEITPEMVADALDALGDQE